jgi:hypothetical protein
MEEINQQTSVVESPGAYYAQDYSLKTLNFLTASGQKIELKKLLVELSYYEDIYNFVVSGYLTVLDSQGFIESMRMTGNEYIEVNFGKIKNGKNLNDQIFRVYKIGGRRPSGNMNSEMYTIYFCSEEMLLSEQSKISKSFKGNKISDIVNNILTDKLKVTDKRVETIEETTGMYDFVVPRLKPFEAISWVSTYARPKKFPGADMLFFETKNGFNFRSLQSMFKEEAYATYKYEQKNLDDKTQPIQEKATTVLQYEIGKPFDMMNEIASGSMANRTITIDPLTRSFRQTDFDYNKFKQQAQTLNKGGVPDSLKNRLGETENQSFEGVVKMLTSNANQANVPYIKEKQGGFAKDIAAETFIPNRTAQISLANYTTIKASIPGDPGLTAGRTVNFNLLSLKPTSNTKELDKFYSGKYLVTAVRHIIQPQGIYQTIMELAKDSSPTSYPTISNDNAEFKKAINT